jgi:hypothetical protein
MKKITSIVAVAIFSVSLAFAGNLNSIVKAENNSPVLCGDEAKKTGDKADKKACSHESKKASAKKTEAGDVKACCASKAKAEKAGDKDRCHPKVNKAEGGEVKATEVNATEVEVAPAKKACCSKHKTPAKVENTNQN